MNKPRDVSDEIRACHREAELLVGLMQALDELAGLVGPDGQPVVAVIEVAREKAVTLEDMLGGVREIL